ncbi:MAG TPA: hypothetical protein VHG32_19220 [Thermoanaerobaculia bacterium]|nr:hypothetical protein [Thermoanaerobaculia bacterium]
MSSAPQTPASLPAEAIERAAERLLQRHGAEQAERIHRGVAQAAASWWPEDGSAEDFVAFCATAFQSDPAELERSFRRLEEVLEQVDGHLHEVRRELLAPIEVDRGAAVPATAVDSLLVHLDLAPHVDEDMFRERIAAFALLNFPLHTLRQRLGEGGAWDRAAWARSRMMERFAIRVPAAVTQAANRASTAAEEYVSTYNIRLDRLITAGGERPFPEGLRLISHWGLRDQLASYYADPDTAAAMMRQRLILRVMERIVRQEIPAAVIDNPELLWDPEANTVRPLGSGQAAVPPPPPPPPAVEPEAAVAAPAAREPDRRYAVLLAIFQAQRTVDPYTPTAPSLPARRFELGRQIPEEEVEALLVSVLDAPEVDELARHIAHRLGRPLEPFDIWYSGFKARGRHGEADLDARVKAAFPSVADFQAALPELLVRLGFAPDRAAWLAGRIVVDSARGAGHALGAVRRQDRSHLRTRVGDAGMDYKAWNVAMHELGHNVEQVFSLDGIDHWWLAGVPNNAFTEAFAFLFQERDLEILGLAARAAEDQSARALGTLWNTYEIAGVSLVDMRVWRWLYAHPDATPAELREAVLGVAREVWDRFFVSRLGHPGCEVLAIYSHMIAYSLYLPDYALGHIVAFQLAAHLRQIAGADGAALGESGAPSAPGACGAELERIARQGRLTPDAWMRGAVGGPVSAAALLAAARQALESPAPAGAAGAS